MPRKQSTQVLEMNVLCEDIVTQAKTRRLVHYFSDIIDGVPVTGLIVSPIDIFNWNGVVAFISNKPSSLSTMFGNMEKIPSDSVVFSKSMLSDLYKSIVGAEIVYYKLEPNSTLYERIVNAVTTIFSHPYTLVHLEPNRVLAVYDSLEEPFDLSTSKVVEDFIKEYYKEAYHYCITSIPLFSKETVNEVVKSTTGISRTTHTVLWLNKEFYHTVSCSSNGFFVGINKNCIITLTLKDNRFCADFSKGYLSC